MKTLEDVRALLAKHRAAIPEFARRCRAELWPEPSLLSVLRTMEFASSQLSRLLASIQGEQAAAEFLGTYGPNRHVEHRPGKWP